MNQPRLLLSPRDLAGLGVSSPQVPQHAPELFREEESGGYYPGSGPTQTCNAARVQLAGGALNTLLVHPEVTPFEKLYRREADPAIYGDAVSPERPVTFELGAFRVPSSFSLLLFDLRPDIYRFSGMDPNDTVPVEARRYSTILGYDLRIDGAVPGNIEFQLNPPPAQAFKQGFTRNGRNLTQGLPPTMIQALGAPNVSEFALAAAQAASSASGAGSSTLPQRPARYGARNVPFTIYVRSGQLVQVGVVAWGQVMSPLAFFEFDIAGMMIPELWVTSMTECMKPLTSASFGPGSLGGGPR